MTLSVTITTYPPVAMGNGTAAQDAQCQMVRVFPVGLQALAALARPCGPAARSVGPSVGGTVDYRENSASSNPRIHSEFRIQ